MFTTDEIRELLQTAADTGMSGPFYDLHDRGYFSSDAAAEDFLIRCGFTFTAQHPRWPWTREDGLLIADVRFNSVGTFIEYRSA